ncbi:hypothetical protein QFC19_008556 [Naganishia cerealis]|uniref:Uncharacterized protein n=1 Tax=Naganishia cerealis TaxID=610337 RepID=A0ACC2V1I7_9TREE|nr:hypothetical protein QFC19_008556 [Naganishia cerealis]
MPFPPRPPPQSGFPFDAFMQPGQIPPPPMVLPLGGAPNYQAGAVMDPLTAILSIVVVAGMYWGFKNGTGGFSGLKLGGGGSGAPPTSDGVKEAEDPKKSSKSSSSSKDKKGEEKWVNMIPLEHISSSNVELAF